MDAANVQYPRCEGKKMQAAIIKSAPHLLSCAICDGRGEISQAQFHLWETGRQLREERLAKGLTLRAAAKLIGCSPYVLSCRERGKPLPV